VKPTRRWATAGLTKTKNDFAAAAAIPIFYAPMLRCIIITAPSSSSSSFIPFHQHLMICEPCDL
jgi:hypothetical protein